MKIQITYCVVWNYEPRASRLAAELRENFPGVTVRLIEGSGGVFEVVADGQTVFSKRQAGRHAEPGEVSDLLRLRMK